MDSDYLKEKARYYTEWIRLLWIALIALIGGMSGLLLAGIPTPVAIVLLIFAVILGIGGVVMVIVLHLAISRLIEKLLKEEEK